MYTTVPEQIFLGLNDEVLFNGQPVGVILADSMALANKAAAKVDITYFGRNAAYTHTIWPHSTIAMFSF